MKTASKLPAVFFGHGSPMNAIEQNDITQGWINSVKDIPRPRAIVCVSAHWMTEGTHITAVSTNRTIHDFQGFPPQLYEIRYDAPGDTELAQLISAYLPEQKITLSESWGLDHGTWSVLRHLYPKANVPILQLSLDVRKTPEEHLELGRKLAFLREKNVLLVASGNIIHNLYRFNWRNPDEQLPWAASFNKTFQNLLNARDFDGLCQLPDSGHEARLAIPTAEHYLPFLYIAAQIEENSQVSLFNDVLMSSLSMTGIRVA